MNAPAMISPLDTHVAVAPDDPALKEGGRVVTWGELRRWVWCLQKAFAPVGDVAGQPIALIGPPGLAFVAGLHALSHAGACVVPLASTLSKKALQDRIQSAEVTALVWVEDVPAWALDTDSWGAAVMRPSVSICDVPCASVDAADVSALPKAAPWPWQQPRLVVFTSGTTAAPKAITLTTEQLFWSSLGSSLRLGYLPSDVWLCSLPLVHMGGLAIIFRALWFKAAVMLQYPFAPAAWLGLLQDGQVQLCSMVPTMLVQLVEHAPHGRWHPSLRAVLLGGAQAPKALVDQALALGLPVAVTWGLTEAASQVATRWPGQAGDATDVGPPLACVSVTQGRDNRLQIMGPILSPYDQMAGGLLSQDVGSVDHRGHVHVSGRIDDMIISGGLNLMPQLPEGVLLKHPAIAEAAVVGQPDRVWGQRPIAFVVSSGVDVPRPSTVELSAFCREHLASWQVPVQFNWRDTLPRNDLGKLVRRALSSGEVPKKGP